MEVEQDPIQLALLSVGDVRLPEALRNMTRDLILFSNGRGVVALSQKVCIHLAWLCCIGTDIVVFCRLP